MDRATIVAVLRQAADTCEADHAKGAPIGVMPPWLRTLLTTLLPLVVQFVNQGSPHTE